MFDWSLFLRYPRVTILAILLTFVAGLGAMLSLVRQEDPTLIERYGFVITTLPGADAERVEALITRPIETRLLELAEVAELQSISRAGVSQIGISMRDDLSEARVDEAWTLVRQQVARAESALPASASAPVVRRQYLGATTLLVALRWEGEGPAPLAVMNREARLLEERLQNLPGTDETIVFGLTREEIRVEPDAAALAAAGLSLPEFARRIAAADAKEPAGRLRSAEGQVGLEVGGAFDGLGAVRDAVITAGPDGVGLRTSDLANVTKGLQQPLEALALSEGRRAVLVGAYLEPGVSVDLWTRNARSVVSDIAAKSPRGLAVVPIFDQSVYTEARLTELVRNLGTSALIVMAVLLVMMGWRSALAVGIALPLTVALVLIMFSIFKFPLHQMSVTGMIIALGLLIDNAIIAVDTVEARRREGHSPAMAIRAAGQYLAMPLLASTITTALAFMPIALLPGSSGEFVGMMAVAVIFAVMSSLLVALTIAPALSVWISRVAPGRPGAPRPVWEEGWRPKLISVGYEQVLRFFVRRRLAALAFGLLLPVAGFMAIPSLPAQFFPPTERNMFQVELTLASDASIEDAEALARRATDLLMQREGVEAVNWVIGETGPRVYYNAFNTVNGLSGYAVGFVKTTSPAATRALVPGLQEELRRTFPQAQFLALPYEQGPPVPAPIEFFVQGPDIRELDRIAQEARAALAETPGVTFTYASIETGVPLLRFEADPDGTVQGGRSLSGVAQELRAGLEGVPAGSVLEGVEEIPVRVVNSAALRGDLGALRGYQLPQAGGAASGAPLAALGDFKVVPQIAVITRKDGLRTNTVYGFLEPYTLPAGVVSAFEEKLVERGFILPAGYALSFGGEAAESGDAVGALFGTALPLLIAMAGCIAMTFNSFRMAGLILFTGVLSIGCAFLGVWLFGLTFGFMAIVGGIGLLGLAVNGAIIVLSAIRENPEARAGDVDAIVAVVMESSRHITATTLTTIGGFVPLIAAADSFWLPLATAIAGGVGGSALLALFFVPAMYRLIRRRQGDVPVAPLEAVEMSSSPAQA